MRHWIGALPLVLVAGSLAAQDPVPPVDQGVRVGIEYTPGIRPRLVVFPGPGFDSVRSILQRDLDYSDRFELIYVGYQQDGASAGSVNYDLYRKLGAQYGVELTPSGSATVVRLHDLDAGEVRSHQTVIFPPPDAPEFRMAVHQISDEIVRWVTGTPGYAASRVAYVGRKRLWIVDSDGVRNLSLTGADEAVLSPPGHRRDGGSSTLGSTREWGVSSSCSWPVARP